MAAVRRRRAAAAGFSLIELMVVVVLISILAMIATPAMRVARDDRLAFDYARRIEQLVHRGRSRAAGRGAAHLFVAGPSGLRGKFLLFEALDNTLPAAGGPNPVSSCKGLAQWADAIAFVPGAVSNTARIVDGFDLDSAGVNVDADIRTAYAVNGVATPAIVICVTPGGATFVGQAGSIAAAVVDMQGQTTSFNTFLEMRVTRNRGGLPVGLQRRVIVAGGAAPRILSQ
jgi:prepilin-type N-terminal cleavage/methylation domain-containing protein